MSAGLDWIWGKFVWNWQRNGALSHLAVLRSVPSGTLQYCNTLQHTARHCNFVLILQGHEGLKQVARRRWTKAHRRCAHSATYCNTVHHTDQSCSCAPPHKQDWFTSLSLSFSLSLSLSLFLSLSLSWASTPQSQNGLRWLPVTSRICADVWHICALRAHVCFRVLQGFAVCYSVLQCVAVCCSGINAAVPARLAVIACHVTYMCRCVTYMCTLSACVAACCGVLRGVAVCCSVLQCIALQMCECICLCTLSTFISHRNTLLHAATYCNNSATHTATYCNSNTHCNILQHIAFARWAHVCHMYI